MTNVEIVIIASVLSGLVSGLFRVLTAWLIYKKWKPEDYEVYSEIVDTNKNEKIAKDSR